MCVWRKGVRECWVRVLCWEVELGRGSPLFLFLLLTYVGYKIEKSPDGFFHLRQSEVNPVITLVVQNLQTSVVSRFFLTLSSNDTDRVESRETSFSCWGRKMESFLLLFPLHIGHKIQKNLSMNSLTVDRVKWVP